MNKYSQKGFTLIELLVVIAIIGILSAVVLPSLSTARQKGQIAAFKSEMDGFRKIAELYYDDNGYTYTDLFQNSAPIATTTASAASQAVLGSLEFKASDRSIHGLTSGNAYALYGRLPGSDTASLVAADIYCVDATGVASNPTVDATDQFTTPVDVCW